MLVDSHCHIDLPELAANLPNVLEQMHLNGVGGAICIGVTLEDFPRVQSLAKSNSRVVATVGVHPENTGEREATVKELVELAQAPEVVAIGETGLDYYWHKDQPEWQRDRFRTHIRAARELGKPLVIHNREATQDVLRLMAEENAGEVGGVLHCFTESWDVAHRVPLDRLLVETDAPYLAPMPYRGKLNQPGYVRYVAEEIACLREIPFEEIAQATTENCFRLFPYARTRMTP